MYYEHRWLEYGSINKLFRWRHNFKVTISPVFSPDGQKIIYTSNESGSNQIYIMKVDGTEKQKITSQFENI
ncbi:MAG: PD40 domain-containing protein [Chitinophagaceae bacterium]|nr:PD40 domain-containing protein [Chitinophagaceae bacterium]